MTQAKGQAQVSLSWDQVAQVLLQAQGIETGLWKLAVNVSFSAFTHEAVDLESGQRIGMPTAMVSMGGLALIEAPEPGPLVYDAATLASPRASAKPARPRKKAAK